MRYRAVLFDVGDTLISPRESYGSTYARVLAGYGLTRPGPVFDDALRLAWDELGRRFEPGVDRYGAFPGGERAYWLAILRRALEEVAGDSVAPDFADSVLDPLRDAFARPEAWVVHEDVKPTLATLRRSGVRLAVVSNWDSRLPLLLERLGLIEYFDELAVSSIEGVEKPDRRLFLHALERLQLDSKDVLHIGDRPEIDLAGATAAGLDCRLVDRHGRLAPRAGALNDLGEIAGL